MVNVLVGGPGHNHFEIGIENSQVKNIVREMEVTQFLKDFCIDPIVIPMVLFNVDDGALLNH